MKSKYTQMIKQQANSLGFMYCGISKAGFLKEEAPRLEKWLKLNMNGKMSYMERNFDKRLDPRLLVNNAKSVISLLLNYFPAGKQKDKNAPKISKYAYGKDYHFVIKEKLKLFMDFIRKNIGDVNGRGFVDSAPVLDRAWAKKSGLGWIGKNSNLINKKNGSFFFIAELIVDLELDYDNPVKDLCGTCTKCIDACPTNAITKPYVVNGSKCISYFTIELRDNIPSEMKGKFKNRVFGCDICQDICPWNRFSTPHKETGFDPQKDLLNMTKKQWEKISESDFNRIFNDSALQRIKYHRFKKNIEFLKKEFCSTLSIKKPARTEFVQIPQE